VRLGTLLLTLAALAAPSLLAQGRPPLPWEHLAPLDWQPGARPGDEPAEGPVPSAGPISLTLAGDGTFQVTDARGLIRLQAGLPGRPLRAWRDGGVPLASATGTWRFPDDSPLAQGLGGLRWCAEDFRPFLRGLLWVIEDGEGFLTVVHPATARVIHLPLPAGRDFRLRFRPDRLVVEAGEVERGAPSRWAIPWMGLLPRLAALGPHPDPARMGTALAPFPKD
jgi:hypothetical protein